MKSGCWSNPAAAFRCSENSWWAIYCAMISRWAGMRSGFLGAQQHRNTFFN
jgi:hypothetical protein